MRPYLRAANVTWDGLDLSDINEMNFPPGQLETFRLQADDILLSEASGSASEVGKPALWRGQIENCCFQNTLIRVRSSGPDPRFLLLHFKADAELGRFAKAARGVGIHHLGAKAMEDWPIQLAPLGEQGRIVDEVEKQFTRLGAAVAGLQRVKANLKRYRASVLKAACEGRLVPTEAELARREGRSFESGEELLKRILKERRARWEADQLARIRAAGRLPRDDSWRGKYEAPGVVDGPAGSPLPGGWSAATLAQLSWASGYGTSTKCAYGASGPPVLRITNVEKARIDLTDLKFALDPAAVSGDAPLERGDFLVVRTSGSRTLIGRGALVREALSRPHHFASYLIRLRLVAGAFCDGWLSIVWQAPQVRAELEGKAATSAGQYNLCLTSLLPTRVFLPPLPEQHRIVAEVERRLSVVDELEATVEKNLARCARLRQSILKTAFEGRLVPQDPNDEPASVLLERIRKERAAEGTKEKRRKVRE